MVAQKKLTILDAFGGHLEALGIYPPALNFIFGEYTVHSTSKQLKNYHSLILQKTLRSIRKTSSSPVKYVHRTYDDIFEVTAHQIRQKRL